MQQVGLFVDVSNLYHWINKKFNGRKLSYLKLLEHARGDDIIFRAFAYGFQLENESARFITCIGHFGYEPKYKKPKTYEVQGIVRQKKSSWDVGITCDVARLVHKLDVVVIASSSGDLTPLVEYIKERGVKCIVYGCGISKELKAAADAYVEITEDLLEDKQEA
jgi:uncharacterized LabA/DUF88 family protein